VGNSEASTLLLVLTKSILNQFGWPSLNQSTQPTHIRRAVLVSQMKTTTSAMRSLYLLLLVGFSEALFQRRESNVTNNITSEACVGKTTTTLTIILSTTGATGSQFTLFPISPSHRLPSPWWDNSTQNFSAPTGPSVPFSATSSLRDNNHETLMYKVLTMMAISILSMALIL
jgi:hypothetical protein